MVAAVAALLDLRRAAELAHPHDQRRVEQAAVLQVGHQRRPGGVERRAEGLHLVEVVLVRVPAAEGDLDEGHVALDQAAGQEAALAELVAAVAVAQRRGLLFEIERLRRLRTHQTHGPVVGGLVAVRAQAGAAGHEVALQRLQQADAGFVLFAADARRQVEVLHGQRRLGRVGDGQAVVADDERGVLRAEEAGAERLWAEEALRSDADEVRQVVLVAAQLLGDERAQRRVLDRPLRQVAGAHQEGGPAVVAFLGGHRADDRHAIAELGDLRQVLADLHAGDVGGDFLELAAVGVAGLEVKGVHLRGAAAHPQQDAGALALRVLGGVLGQHFEPAGHREADDAGRGQSKPVAAGQGRKAGHEQGSPRVSPRDD